MRNITRCTGEEIIYAQHMATSIQQPFIFAEFRSKYKGIDPETSDVVNNNQIPSVRQITFGLNAKF